MQRHSYHGLGADGGFHRISYTEWGPRDAPVLICVHGLTRNGRDFDTLAIRFEKSHRVICPDVVGRGESDWLADPMLYGYPQYLADLNALIARLDVTEVAWLGTSMGALLGMFMAAGRNSPIRKLLINDAGPVIPKTALQRIASYLGSPPRFADTAAAEAYLREVHASFGPLTDAQWRHLTRHSVRTANEPAGQAEPLALKYDPAIAQPFALECDDDIILWSVWDAVTCPVTVIRGENSDLLSLETAEEMNRRGPRAALETVADVGHAPALMADDQLDIVARWLAE